MSYEFKKYFLPVIYKNGNKNQGMNNLTIAKFSTGRELNVKFVFKQL